MTDLLTCELCHIRGSDVTPGLAWYRDATSRTAVQTIDRCIDHAACRRRVEAAGERWPLRDREEVAA